MIRDWPSIELVFGTLLVTSFTVVGLVTLWAVAARQHWFLRIAVVAALLAPLLAIPAYEPLLLFAFQSFVVAALVAMTQWKPWRRQNWRRPRISLSLKDALLGIAVIALLVAIAVRIPTEVRHSIPQILLVGGTFAAATLIAAWFVFGHAKSWWRGALMAIFALVITLQLAVLNDWPKSFTDTLTLEDFQNWQAFVNPPFVTSIWLGIVSATIATIFGVLLLVRAQRQASNRFRPAFALAVALSVTLILLPPAMVARELAHPARIPIVELPTPNGYDNIVRGGEMIESGSRILNLMVEPKSTQDLANEVAKFSSAYAQIRLGLSRPCALDVFPANGDFDSVLDVDKMGRVRAAGRAMMRAAELARQEHRYRDAAMISVENVRLGEAVTRGGLMVDYLVGQAIEGFGRSTLVTVIGQLDGHACRETIAGLETVERSREPLSDILHRERIWSENAYGWIGHLSVLLDEWAAPRRSNDDVIADSFVPRTQAITRLLIVDLALRQYQLDHDEFPSDLRQLVPEFLKNVPNDPFAPNDQPLRYRRLSERYLLYSVAFDGDDDEGQVRTNEELEWQRDGDLSLETYYWEELGKAGITRNPDAGEMSDQNLAK